MENAVQIFKNQEFGRVRTVVINNEVWFVGKDLADALGYSNTRDAVSKHVDDEDKLVSQFATSGQIRNMTVVNESGLFSLVVDSCLPSAKKFRRWITSEVLPQIRQNGSYGIPQTTAGQIKLLAQGNIELEQKINSTNQDLQDFKVDIPMFPVEVDEVSTVAKRKGVEVLGGKGSAAYADRSLKGRVYKDIYREVHRQFGVESFKAIRRRDELKAIEMIRTYQLPMALKSEIAAANAQMTLNIH
jgi:prophage antirepressor-like protein